MTSKQCNSCKYLIYVKELGERCFNTGCKYLFKNITCPYYKNGEINQGHKEYFKKVGREYPFTEIR